ncbi:tRNA (adenosine(37)-N6)-threonylcarbamoyltransferase complex dimerization subunit type 1 TsaB [Cryomorpha ignava]|uniref:tRNA (Adenosine(37)-N6)-threonylcarbamoyltransferase complex dimerization subunit type 1 TsaB n=1 Tax=Cryomorpha ignava TaxID=101383 RepID=A0A7K3WUJ1_9FLAO|nr:tRNA (adenosine(37)-N6)-threonylcarbamoyltransferase complex dimerization subunit type 1 TsaB [Cryomorpha ignava]NEN25166.1 tRNA (adenosine(37)-N6)-threonylcarbamoyltransferase complex dimerization subunit type 1 TsaB [Cryomorpha ignava]
MARILCIETSTKVCSVCVAEGDAVLALAEDNEDEYTHAEKLNVLIAKVLEESDLKFKDLSAIAVSEGPGSYTGLRIGVSAAKGFAVALDIPIIAVNTLKAMSAGVGDKNQDSLLIPMIDARRMEVFCAGFTGDLQPAFETRAEILSSESFPEAKAFTKVLFFGNGAEKCRGVLEPLGFEYFPDVSASANGMAKLANEKFKESDFVDTAYFEPFYLKDFVAGKPKAS